MTENTKKAATQAAGKKDTNEEALPPAALVVISTNHRQPRRRAGLRFTPEGVTIDPATLTEKQRDAIMADPHLVVKPVALAAGD